MKKYLILISALLLSNCAAPVQGGSVFIPKEVTPTSIKNGDVNICREVILSENGSKISKLNLLTGKIKYKEVFYHRFTCVNALPPHEKFNIPADVWYRRFDDLYYPTNYIQLKGKIATIQSICDVGAVLNLTCEKTKNSLKVLDEFLLEEK